MISVAKASLAACAVARRCMLIYAFGTGLGIGGVLTWIAATPPHPWVEFNSLSAIYPEGSTTIAISGSYEIHRECSGTGIGPPIWRVEALATDGQVALYGPKPQVPVMTTGIHYYGDTLPLLKAIKPDGWVIRILTSCPGRTPETVASRAVLVQVVPQGMP